MNCIDVVKLAPCMRPAGNFVDRAAFIEMMKAGIRIGLQSALEVFEMLARMFALAIGRVREPDGRRSVFTGGPFVAHIGPQAACLGLAVAGSKHRNGRVIGV